MPTENQTWLNKTGSFSHSGHCVLFLVCCLGSSLIHTQRLKYQNGLVYPNLVYVCICAPLHSYHAALLLGCNAMAVEHFYAFPFCACVPCVAMPSCVFIGCQAGSCGCLGVRLRMYVCVCGEAVSHCGPPARPCDSWGPLRQMRPTAHSDSIIMGSLLLRFPQYTLWHMHTDTHAHRPHIPGLSWPFPWVLSNQATAGATCPSQKGKAEIFDISIKLPYEDSGGDREAGLTFLCFMFVSVLLCLSLFLALFVVNTRSNSEIEVRVRFLWLPPRTWTEQPGWRTRRNVLSWWEHFIKTHLFSALVHIIVFKPSANHTDSSSRSAGCSQ